MKRRVPRPRELAPLLGAARLVVMPFLTLDRLAGNQEEDEQRNEDARQRKNIEHVAPVTVHQKSCNDRRNHRRTDCKRGEPDRVGLRRVFRAEVIRDGLVHRRVA